MPKIAFTHVVVRPFDANGKTLEAGALVDASMWKNVEKLVAVKYLRQAGPADLQRAPKNPTKAPAGSSVASPIKIRRVR